MSSNNPHVQPELSTACLPRQGLHRSYVGNYRYGRNWQCHRALQGSDKCHGRAGKLWKRKCKNLQKVMLMEQLISSFLLPEEGSVEVPASGVIHTAFLTTWVCFFHICVKKLGMYETKSHEVCNTKLGSTDITSIFLCTELWNFLPRPVPMKSRTGKSPRSMAPLKIKRI